MTAPERSPGPGGTQAIAWMALTSLVLLATAILHLIFVLPVFQALMAAWGAQFSAPSRLALGLARYGLVLGIFWASMFGLYVWYREAPGRRERLASALGATALALALYLALFSWTYVDVAIALPSQPPAAAGASPTPVQ